MAEFAIGDRVRTIGCAGVSPIAGKIVGTLMSAENTPWPLVRVTHSPDYPSMVGNTATWRPVDLEHID